jgi:hypothetical protein
MLCDMNEFHIHYVKMKEITCKSICYDHSYEICNRQNYGGENLNGDCPGKAVLTRKKLNGTF